MGNAFAECVNESPCNRDDCYTENSFFPKKACEELEVSMFFPGCWDGVSLDSDDHMSHVAYSEDGEIDGQCPQSHPVKIPVIALFFRIFEYDGGWHTFSDGSSIYHADYVSGWDETFLQGVLDNCENDSFGPNPNAFCEDHITFRDAPKCTDEDKCDFADPALGEKLREIQPTLKNFQLISPEETKTIEGDLPRGTCNGTLLPKDDDDNPSPVCGDLKWKECNQNPDCTWDKTNKVCEEADDTPPGCGDIKKGKDCKKNSNCTWDKTNKVCKDKENNSAGCVDFKQKECKQNSECTWDKKNKFCFGCGDVKKGKECKENSECAWDKKKKVCKAADKPTPDCQDITKKWQCNKISYCTWYNNEDGCMESACEDLSSEKDCNRDNDCSWDNDDGCMDIDGDGRKLLRGA